MPVPSTAPTHLLRPSGRGWRACALAALACVAALARPVRAQDPVRQLAVVTLPRPAMEAPTVAVAAGEWVQLPPGARVVGGARRQVTVDGDGRLFARGAGDVVVRVGRPGDTVLVRVTEPPADQLPVRFRFEGWNPTADERAAVEQAGARWRRVLRRPAGDRPAAQVKVPAGECGSPLPFTAGRDGLTVVVSLHDDEPGTLAWGTPCVVAADGRTVVAAVRINQATIESLRALPLGSTQDAVRQLEQALVHEIGHGLGLMELLPHQLRSGALVDTSAGTPRWVGRHAAEAWRQLGGRGGVPLDHRRAHWHGDVRVGDIMEPVGRGREALSILTVAALADLGYAVRPSAAEPLEGTLLARAP